MGRYLDFNDSGQWLTLTYVIDEGPRYQIRNVTLVGNDTFTTPSLMERLELTSGQFFDSRKMNRDLSELRDTYGSQGYIHADIKADPQFLEEPGMIDLVYDIQEGDQYRVGKITVNIEGDNPHTRRNVVINRLSLAPNDIIDIREIRASERRLKSSELFLSDPTQGVSSDHRHSASGVFRWAATGGTTAVGRRQPASRIDSREFHESDGTDGLRESRKQRPEWRMPARHGGYGLGRPLTSARMQR